MIAAPSSVLSPEAQPAAMLAEMAWVLIAGAAAIFARVCVLLALA